VRCEGTGTTEGAEGAEGAVRGAADGTAALGDGVAAVASGEGALGAGGAAGGREAAAAGELGAGCLVVLLLAPAVTAAVPPPGCAAVFARFACLPFGADTASAAAERILSWSSTDSSWKPSTFSTEPSLDAMLLNCRPVTQLRQRYDVTEKSPAPAELVPNRTSPFAMLCLHAPLQVARPVGAYDHE